MGKVSKGITCSVKGCGEAAVRSLGRERMAESGLQTSGERRVFLCRSHYREWKKATKRDRELERLRYG